jgi:nucleoid-associated protein YgaU
MARESKVGLLVGMAIILLIGIVVSDHLSTRPSREGGGGDLGASAMTHRDESSGGRGLSAWQPRREEDARRRASSPDRPIPTPEQIGDEQTKQEEAPRNAGAEMEGARASRVVRAEAGSVERAASGDERVPEKDERSEKAEGDTAGNEAQGGAALRVHHVQEGETLWSIAQQHYGDGGQWRRIAEANPEAVQEDGVVRTGVRLRVPHGQGAGDEDEARRPPRVVTVKPGDTLREIARRKLDGAESWERLYNANREKLEGPRSLSPGQKLVLPSEDR